MISDELLRKYPIISEQITHGRLRVVLGALECILQQKVPGDVVEFGCYIGTTSLFLRRLLDAYEQAGKRELHVYDSFAGLPEKSAQDSSVAGDQFKAGELSVSKKQLLHEFRKANLRPPIAHKAWFADLTVEDAPEHIAFAFLDGDFYDSVMDSLRLVWPRLELDGIIAVDDYGREALPGTERAVRNFLQNKASSSLRVEHNIAIIKP
jgi:Macrocin-O-methyltransferase (TylF)